jgi:hypoxanthine phosphoribosyltransferase
MTSSQAIQVLFSAEAIAERVGAVARCIAEVRLDDPLMVAILKGSFVFAADLLRALHQAGLSPEVDFMSLASYREATRSSGQVEIVRDIETDVRGRSIVIVDDILESGRTLAFAKRLLSERGAVHVLTCVLLNKRVERAVPIEPDFSAFECPNEFVVGYGMDLARRFRELPFVGRLVHEA